MIVLKIIGFVLLALLVLLLLIGLFVLPARARVDFRGENGAVELRVGLGPLRLKIWPLPEALRKRKPPVKEERPEVQEPRQGAFSMENVDFADVLDLLFEILGHMRDRLFIETVWVQVIIGTGDAARTGLLLGYSAAATGMILPFLEQNFNMKTCHIAVDGDFESAATRWKVKLVVAMRPGSVLAVLFHHRKRLYGLYRQMVKKEGAKTYERTSN